MSTIKMPVSSPRQLKDRIKNLAKENNLPANAVLQNFMMERFLERIAVSRYRDNFILKGGFLIAAMVGIDMRSTMDIDTTLKGIPVNESEIKKIITEILNTSVNDNVYFEMDSVQPIHDSGEYNDFRIGLTATFFTMKIKLKLDITTGDSIIPSEIDYSYKLMFENRDISIKAYNLQTILAEKIESILARNVTNTRLRDYYDVYILLNTRYFEIQKSDIQTAVRQKSEERGTTIYVENYMKYLDDIRISSDLSSLWDSYAKKYPYSSGISFDAIIEKIGSVLSGI
ncbi:MAG: nucleotidyl transferase AbiEii/AbiGii toxin family protein [Candidatus Dojkabacteria bacterium]